jgi:hypothetical protein
MEQQPLEHSKPISASPNDQANSYLDKLSSIAAAYFVEHPETVGILESQQKIDAKSQIFEYLKDKPRLQQKVGELLGYNPSRWLSTQEIPVINQQREIHDIPHINFETDGDPYMWARKSKLQGICFSGGGIRSATFNLGVLQGLAKLGLLSHFDYLSTVSGGGYIHEWLAGWIKREEQDHRDRAQRDNPPAPYTKGSGFEEVRKKLVPLPSTSEFPIHAEPIRWLRRYSNYLTPRKGMFTGDTWVAFAIWLRNTFLNQMILISGLFFLLLCARLIAELIPLIPSGGSEVAAIVLFLIATGTIGIELQNEWRRIKFMDEYKTDHQDPEPQRRWGGEKTIQAFVVLPLLLASVLYLNVAVAVGKRTKSIWDLTPEYIAVFVLLALMVAVAALSGSALKVYRSLNRLGEISLKEGWKPCAKKISRLAGAGIGGLIVMNAVMAALGGTLLYVLVGRVLAWNPSWWIPCALKGVEAWRFRSALGPPLLLAVPFFTLVLGAGLVGRDFPDWLREWLARVRAWALLSGCAWAFFFGVALLGPSLIHWPASARLSAVATWLVTTAGSVLAGKSNKTSGKPLEDVPRNLPLDVLARVGAYVFIVGLLILLSFCVEFSIKHSSNPLLLMFVPLVIFLIFGWRVDVNDFSMNPFYRNRLTRCYLGASNRHRSPNPLTGFDDRDTRGLQVSKLTPEEGYTGPYPIFCTAINLTFGEDLAWQERKAASFFFAPVCSGYHVNWSAGKPGRRLSCCGFVPTAKYAFPEGGINMATAVAISGAAASPNWGYHSDPATAFLMTMFNVRLGWWLFNPRRPSDEGNWASPRFSPLELTKELLGMVNDTSKFVYLSDGGHFDNMGLYELVRRRCYRIVICDAEQDENYFFEGIANAIRKCRIDFGVEITLDLSNLRALKTTGNCRSHWAAGKIRYPETPANSSEQEHEGEILYIKSSLTGPGKHGTTALPIEPVDIINYRYTHQHFPHDTTANQWFTESQFESYRRLGYHIVDEINACSGWTGF